MTTPAGNPKPKPMPGHILPKPTPHPAERLEFAVILGKINEKMARLDEAESILADIHDQMKRYAEVSPFTAARLRIFMEGK